MANHLKPEKLAAVMSQLVEGSSVASTTRLTGVNKRTILSHLLKTGQACARLMDKELRNIDSELIQCDEIWDFVGKKQRWVDKDDLKSDEIGDIWVFVAIDAATKLVPSYRVGKRTTEMTRAFVEDLASRMSQRVQISSDQFAFYASAVAESFGKNADYGQIVKEFTAVPVGPGRYAPPKVTHVTKIPIIGTPNEADISTSYVERNNLNIRMGVRRFTRLTNAFSKKLENHEAAVALWFAHYNFGRIHKTLRVTPAMAAGVTSTVWSMPELIERALAA